MCIFRSKYGKIGDVPCGAPPPDILSAVGCVSVPIGVLGRSVFTDDEETPTPSLWVHTLNTAARRSTEAVASLKICLDGEIVANSRKVT